MNLGAPMSERLDPRALWNIGYGLYVVGSVSGSGQSNAQIANAVMQITSEPPQVAVALNTKNFTHDCVLESGVFSVSVLGHSVDMNLVRHFGFRCGRDIDKFEEWDYVNGVTGAPVVEKHAVSVFECRVVHQVPVGTHTLFTGEVVAARVVDPNMKPLSYAEYHSVKKGKEPATAPTYRGRAAKQEKKGESAMKKYVCEICGYVYDPEKGDSEQGIEPGTSFEDLPDSWVCPVCGAPKSQFSEV